MDWYQALFDYGQAGRDGGAAPPAGDDADNELIPRLVRGTCSRWPVAGFRPRCASRMECCRGWVMSACGQASA